MGALRTGGQGSVYKGRRIGPIISAVKILPTPIHTEHKDDKNFRNFQNEVEKLKKVNEVPNPNVVKILNSGLTESGSFPFIEMEYIDGPDLEELLKPPHDAVFTVKEVIKLADHLANALAHCHKVGVKHGDIKSNNVKYNIHSGNYVLLDFGLAIMSDEQRRTSMRHAGAIEFMAPEQNTGTMLFQTDIYSYGIIIYELLAGQVPFPLQDSGETSRNTVMIAHMESPVPNLLALRKKNLPESWAEDKKEREMHIPLWLLNLVDKCLEKVPENRYSNGMELQEAIIDGTINTIKTDVVADNLNTNVIINQGVNGVAQPGTLRKENNGLIRISKPAFWGLMILLAGFMASTGYFLFFTHRNIKREIKSSAVPAADSSARMEATRKMERKKATDSATLKAIREEILKQRKNDIGSQNEADSNSTAPDTIANPSPN
ncbi:MAG: prkC 3, partial [Mucilaginibacter sp.]|nr:prkC 3 [Mucilaginibacter sp.]